MKRFIKIINAAFVGLLFSTLGIVGHVSAMPSGMHHGGVTEHNSSSTNCVTVCLGTPADKKREQPVFEEDDDEPEPPYYLQFESAQTGWFAEKSIVSRSIEEPEKIPKYQLCGVMRR